jgi:glycosyltransferase involved in cell wall biosynthesis
MNKFYILVPFYNCYYFLNICLQSILQQSYKNWVCILFDDGSTDKSIKICKYYISKYPNKFKYIKLSNYNNGPSYSKYNGIQYIKKICNDEDIFIIIDGDDYLLNKNALDIINNKYIEKKCWGTFGSYQGKWDENQKKINKNKYNRFDWFYSPPRTCKCFLLKLFNEYDFKYKDNSWLKKGTDIAFFCNIIEWSGIENIEYIKDIIYKYRDHPNNIYKKTSLLLKNHVKYIKEQPMKKKINYIYIK